MCIYPRLFTNRKYTLTKKNGGNPPPITDKRTQFVPIACQYCIECRKAKAREWQARLTEDIKDNKNGKFITLTFSDKAIRLLNIKIIRKERIASEKNGVLINTTGYDRDNKIAKLGVRLWLERHRKHHKKSIRHWLITELGQTNTERIHLHGIIWIDDKLNPKTKEITKWTTTLQKHWAYGHVWIGKPTGRKDKQGNEILQNYVNEATVNYITKYVNKVDKLHTTYISKICTSKGIGANYIKSTDALNNAFNEDKTKEIYRTRTGFKLTIPIYWRNKLYTEEQREKLWIHKLNRQTRYVRGEKIYVRNEKEEKEYNKLLIWHQKRNIELGYQPGYGGSWEQQQYEKERRNMKRAEMKNRYRKT